MSNQERESFVFYRSFFDQLEELSAADAFPLYRAIARYGLLHEEPDLKGIQKVVFIGVRAQLEANWKRWENGIKGAGFGKLGGAPKGNQNARKTTPKQGQNNPKTTPNENENVNVNENENENENVKGDVGENPPCRRFTPPSLQEVEAYLRAKGIGNVSAEAFVAFYESNGWKVGKNPMKNWKAAVTTWRKRNDDNPRQRNPDRGPDTAPTMNYFDFSK